MDDYLPGILAKAGIVSYRDQPIEFASGLYSPIYINNRDLWGIPAIYNEVIAMLDMASDSFRFNTVAGIESAAVPFAAMLARELQLPYATIRKEEKGHGLRKRIEGAAVQGSRVLLIEDHLSTGGSVLRGIESVRDQRGVIAGVMAITSYDLSEARQMFKKAAVKHRVLVPFKFLLRALEKHGCFQSGQIAVVREWHSDPRRWSDKYTSRTRSS